MQVVSPLHTLTCKVLELELESLNNNLGLSLKLLSSVRITFSAEIRKAASVYSNHVVKGYAIMIHNIVQYNLRYCVSTARQSARVKNRYGEFTFETFN